MSLDSATPAVCVVIPCYNHARYLPAAVASVVGQTYHDWEIVIVDDGSADDSADVARGLMERFRGRPIRLIQQENRGQGASRNTGIAATDAPYILTLDADDMIHARFLERTVDAIKGSPDVGFVSTNVRFFGAEQGRWSGGQPTAERMLFDCRMSMEVLFRRAAWEQAGGFEERRSVQGYEDWDFWLRLIERGWRGALVPEELCWYRRSAMSQLIRATPDDLRHRAQLAVEHQGLYAPAFHTWGGAVLRGWDRRTPIMWWRWFCWYAILVARHAPRELPKTLLRPAFKALGPRPQMLARRLAQLLRISRAE